MVKRSLRLLALVTDAFGGYGGIAQYNRDFLTAFAACDRVAEILVQPRLGSPLQEELPPWVRQPRPIKGRIAYSLAALRIARSTPIDVVFCGHLYMAPLAAVIAKLFHAPLWVQVHGIEAWQELSGVHRRALESATLITSVSRLTRRRLLARVGIDPARVKVLPNTVNSRFCPGPKPARLLDQYHAWGKKVLLTVSRLASAERYKGHDRVIRALPRVLGDHPETIYIILGDGDDRPRLEALATKEGLRKHVLFAGWVKAEDLPDHYRLADVFVMPSTGEGFGIAFLEALASGIHVIGGNRDGSIDALGDGALGKAVNPDNADELSWAICAALSTPPENDQRASRFNAQAFSKHLQALVSSNLIGRN